ncbi:MAG: translation elongation factor Ts [Gemmataceae bacterium]
MEIKAADVMKLRDKTGVQMMKCKEALIAAGGDFEKALENIRVTIKGAENRPDRVTADGRVGVFIDAAGTSGGIVELRCESSPVAKNEMFVKLANDLAKQVAVKGQSPAAELLAQPFVDDASTTMKERVGQVVGLMRENVEVARCAKLQGLVGSYVHHDGSVGVLLAVEGARADPQVLRDVCMHIAAKNPVAALREQVSKEKVAKEREIALAQAQEQGKGKPANIVEKIAEGKLAAWFKDQVLAEQPFVKDESKTVGELLKAAGLTLKQFVRYRVGEAVS